VDKLDFTTYNDRVGQLKVAKAQAEEELSYFENKKHVALKRDGRNTPVVQQITSEIKTRQALIDNTTKEMEALKKQMKKLEKDLNETEKAVFNLRYYKGKKIRTIARILGYSDIRIKQLCRAIHLKINKPKEQKTEPKKQGNTLKKV